MAAVNGTTGNFSATISAVEIFALVRQWSASYTRAFHDVSVFTDSTAGRSRIVGLVGFSGSLEGFVDVSATQATNFTNWQSDSVVFILTASNVSGGRTYSFTGQFTSKNVEADTRLPVTIRGDFKATGAVTVA